MHILALAWMCALGICVCVGVCVCADAVAQMSGIIVTETLLICIQMLNYWNDFNDASLPEEMSEC